MTTPMSRGGQLTRPQAIVLRALSHGGYRTARELGVRSDVLWRLEERGLVGRNLHQQWHIRQAGTEALDRYTTDQVDRIAGQAGRSDS